MAEKPTGPFFGPSPEGQAGPFSAWLDPREAQQRAQRPIDIPAPGGPISPFAAAAAITGKFLEGVTAGRVRGYATEQANRYAQWQQLNQTAQNLLSNDDLNDAGRQLVLQASGNYTGSQLVDAVDQAQKGQKKSDQPPGLGHKVGEIIKEIGLGMVGGKMPKGYDKVDADQVKQQIVGKLFQVGPDGKSMVLRPEFSRKSQQDTVGQQAQQALEGATTYEDANKKLIPLVPSILQAYGPQEGKAYIGQILDSFQRSPAPGSPDEIRKQFLDSFPQEKETPPGAEAGAAGPPSLTPRQLGMAEMSGMIKDKGNIVFTGPDGKLRNEYAQFVTTPKGSFWYTQDDKGAPVPVTAGDIRKSTASSAAHYGKPFRGDQYPPGTKDKFGNPLEPTRTYVQNLDSTEIEPTVGTRTSQFQYAILAGPDGKPAKYALDPQTGRVDHLVGQLPVGYDWKPIQNPDGTTDYEAVPKQFQTPGAPPPSGPPKAEPTGGGAPKGGGPAKQQPKGTPSPDQAVDQRVAAVEKTSGRKLTAEERSAVAANPFAKKVEPKPEEKPEQKESKAPGTLERTADGRTILHAGAKSVPLGQAASKSLQDIDAAYALATRLKNILATKDPDTGKPFYEENGIWDKARRLKNFAKYKAGFSTDLDDLLNQKQSFIALNEVIDSLPYLRGTRNQTRINQIQAHIPSPTDTPKNMWEKINNILETIPQLRESIIDTEKTRKVGNKIVGPASNLPGEIGESPF